MPSNTTTERRGFYFFYSHNERPELVEEYSFAVELAAADGTWRHTVSTDSTTFAYRPLPRYGRASTMEPFRLLSDARISSTELPALLIFAVDVPAGQNIVAEVTAYDQQQHGRSGEAVALASGFTVCGSEEYLQELPLLPAAPRIFVKPLTYEIYTTSDGPFPADYRMVIESLTGYQPRVSVNEDTWRPGQPLGPARALDPIRWDVARRSVQLNPPDGRTVEITVTDPGGPETQARYALQEMDRLGAWGFELDGVDPVTYQDAPGGRTDVVPYGAIAAAMVDAPVVSRSSHPPSLPSAVALDLLIGDRRHSLSSTVSWHPAEPFARTLQDERGRETTFYAWCPRLTTGRLALVDYPRRLARAARQRGFFAASGGDSVRAQPRSSVWAHNVLGLGASAVAGQAVTFVSGSLETSREMDVTIEAAAIREKIGA